jgi:hypothetical protein
MLEPYKPVLTPLVPYKLVMASLVVYMVYWRMLWP